MKLCVDCKWFEKGAAEDGYCNRPTGAVNPITGGRQKHEWRMASTHRGIPYILALLWNSCSVGGRFWEPK